MSVPAYQGGPVVEIPIRFQGPPIYRLPPENQQWPDNKMVTGPDFPYATGGPDGVMTRDTTPPVADVNRGYTLNPVTGQVTPILAGSATGDGYQAPTVVAQSTGSTGSTAASATLFGLNLSSPWTLGLIAVGAYFLFFKKK